MSTRLPILGRVLISMLLFAWPFGGLLYIPIAGYLLTTLLMLALITIWLLHMAATRTARIPFELAWPVPILIIAAWIAPGQGSAWNLTLGLLSFLAIVHFVDGSNASASLLRLTAAAGALLAVPILAVITLDLVRSLYPPGVMPGAPNVSLMTPAQVAPENAVIFLTTYVISMFALWHVRRVAGRFCWLRVILLGVVLLEALGLFALRVVTDLAKDYYELPDRGLIQWVALGLCVWLFARVGAKAAVRLREQGAPGYSALLLTGVALLSFVVLPSGESIGPFLVLGALVGNGQTGHATAISTIRGVMIAIPVISLALLNLGHVTPENSADPRNYEAVLRRAVQTGHLDHAWQHIDLLVPRHEGERRVSFWRARIALEYQRPYLAARELSQALRPPDDVRQLLPPPTEDEVNAFLVRLRDYCSSLPNPERVLAYERALIAARRLGDSMASLAKKAEALPEETPLADSNVLHSALGWYLRAPGPVLDAITPITAGQCQALLRACGAEFRVGVLPIAEDPVWHAVEFGLGSVDFVVEGYMGRMVVRSSRVADYSDTPLTTRWEVGSDAPPPLCTLIAGPDPSAAGIESVDLSATRGGPRIRMIADLSQPLPDAPAVLVLLP